MKYKKEAQPAAHSISAQLKCAELLIVVCIILGAILRVWLIAAHPIWLDEQYSLLFAWTESPLHLLVQSKDSHPGFFYACLKGLLFFTRDLFVLRVILAMLPQLVGSLLVVREFWLRKKTIAATWATFFLFLNPFLIYLGFQLRMYGMVCLVASCTFLALQKGHREGWSTRNIFLAIATLFLGNAISYSYYFVSGGVLLLLAVQCYRRRNAFPMWTLAISTGFLAEFVVLAGLSVKHKFEDASSWIPLPSVQSFSSLSLTITGFENNFGLWTRNFKVADVLFYLCIALFLFVIVKKFKELRSLAKKSTVLQDWFFVIVLPVLAVILSSYLMSFLSQRFFFYQFVPKLSLFLPRVFTPLLFIGSCLLAQSIGTWFERIKNTQQLRRMITAFVLVVIVLCVGWSSSILEFRSFIALNKLPLEANKNLYTHATLYEQKYHLPTYFLPSWTLVNQIDPLTIENSTTLVSKVEQSDQLTRELFSEKQPTCDVLKGKIVLSSNFGLASTIRESYQDQVQLMEKCCKMLEAGDQTKAWLCL